jgi:hypothetical protein
MDSKKTIIILGLTSLFIAFFISANAQYPIRYKSNIFLITAPAIDYQLLQNRTPYAKAFLETGSGAFFILNSSGYEQQPLPQQPWYFKSTGMVQPVLQFSTFYDTIGRPPRSYSLILSSENTQGTNPIQHFLGTQYVTLTNAVSNSILPNDTMTTAITYKNFPSPYTGEFDGYSQSMIGFFYNNSDNTKLFQPIPNATDLTYNFNGTNVRPIRIPNGEEIRAFDALPSSIQDIMRTNFTGYSNMLYFKVPYIPNGVERNIFLSMIPSSILNIDTANPGSYKVVLVDYNNAATLSTVNTFTQSLVTNLSSHDPNFIIASPGCLGHLTTGRKIDYEIQFVNDGRAMANTIKDTVSIPAGINLVDNGVRQFTCILGGDTVPVFKENSLVIKGKRLCFYRVDTYARKIYFTIQSAGLSNYAGWFGKKNVGTIKFSLKTNPEPGRVYQCMYSTVAIKFDDNKPVRDTCLIRINCKPDIKCPITFNDPGAGN